MTTRLTSALLVSAMIRQVNADGGSAVLRHRGEHDAGAILLILLEKGKFDSVRERVLDVDGRYAWLTISGVDSLKLADYLNRRLARDPDLWLVELDIAEAERFAAQLPCDD